MRLIRARSLTWFSIGVSSLLLSVAANCSSLTNGDKTTEYEGKVDTISASQPAADDYYAAKKESFVANPFCKACHLDFDEDKLALDHELAGIGCERCHGESLKHRSDEANITPPQLMYSKDRINPMCMMCHPRHEIRHVEDHQPLLEAGLSVFEDEEAGDSSGHAAKYCVDCHGPDHRMKVRTVRWDKRTGELLP